MRVRFSLELLFRVRAGKNSEVNAHAGVLTGLQIKHCIADVCHLMNAGYFGSLHRLEYQIRSRSSVRDIIATDDRIDQVSVPVH